MAKLRTGELTEAKEESQKRNKNLSSKNAKLRNRLQWSSEKAFIIHLEKHHEDVELRRGRFASQFQEIGNSGIETNTENEIQR